MPDMHLGPDGRVELDHDPDDLWAARARAIVDCELCDDEGYRGTVVCDHVDHTAAAMRGRKLVQAELAKIRRRRAERTRAAAPPSSPQDGRTPPPACDRTPEPDRGALRANQSPDREDDQ